jgi:hypothetical protein
MTRTQLPPTTEKPKRYRGLAWAVAAFLVVLAVAGLNLVFRGDAEPVTGTGPTPTSVAPTTVAPQPETMTDLEIISAGVEALYYGDAERAVELFELPVPNNDAWIHAEAAYQATIDARVTLSCWEGTSPGTFRCHMPYHNAMTDAIGWIDHGDRFAVVVEDGVITEFSFPAHSFIDTSIGSFIGAESRECGLGVFPESSPREPECARLILDNLDEWAAEARDALSGF